MSTNLQVMKLLMSIFRLKQKDLCCTGYSKVYISRVISGDLPPSDDFFIKLNSRLLEIITKAGSASSIFEVAPVRLDNVRSAAEVLLKAG